MNRLSALSLVPLVALSLVIAGCPAAPPVERGTAAATAAPSPTSAAITQPAGKPKGVAAGRSWEFPVVAGTSCDGHKGTVSPGDANLQRDAASGRYQTGAKWGCGCPTGPVFTMVYEPRTSPLKVRLCTDPENDHCEALCSGPVTWDLDGPLREAGAHEVVLAR